MIYFPELIVKRVATIRGWWRPKARAAHLTVCFLTAVATASMAQPPIRPAGAAQSNGSASASRTPQNSSPPSGAQPAAAPKTEALPADILDYFRGQWKGKGNFASGKELQSEISFVPDLENQCMVVRQDEKSPNTFRLIALWSMDSITGDLVMLLTSNHNAGARLFRSHGWQAGKLVFESTPELHSYFAFERMTVERDSATSFRTTYEMSPDGKTWRLGDRQSFTKSTNSP